MTEEQKIQVNIEDAESFRQFLDLVFRFPMERKMTGSIKIHLFEGEIRAVEMTPMWKTNKRLTDFLKTERKKT